MAVLEYPVQLAIAYLFLVGYLWRTLFVSVRLPASVGVILSGFVFSHFLQEDIKHGRDHLQSLAFFLVLLTAGLEIRIKDLRPYIFVMALLPATFEILAIAAYGVLALHYTAAEGLVLGTVLVCIGDGLVIPKMKEFQERFKGHAMPRLIFTWAPLEASYALTLFGVLVGLSAPANMPSVNMGLLVLANVVRILATVGAGAVLGAGSGWLITRRTQVTFMGQQVFTGAAVEAFLMVLAVTLIAFGLGAEEGGQELVPMGFSPGSLFQPELLVIVTGTFFSSVAEHDVLHGVEGILGGVWIFGQLMLFSMLGSRTTTSIFPQLPRVLPIMAVGLTFRFIGVFFATFLTIKMTPAEHCPFQRSTAAQDALFCFLSTLPRATIQGALGAVPVTQRFFQHSQTQETAENMIFLSARLYIVVMSVCGMILLNIIGSKLLEATSAGTRVALEQGDGHAPGGTGQVPVEPEATEDSEGVEEVVDPFEAVSAMYALSTEQIYEAIHKAVEHEESSKELAAPVLGRSTSDSTTLAALATTTTRRPVSMEEEESKEALARRKVKLRRLRTGLVLAQFDMPGSQTAPSPVAHAPHSCRRGGLWEKDSHLLEGLHFRPL